MRCPAARVYTEQLHPYLLILSAQQHEWRTKVISLERSVLRSCDPKGALVRSRSPSAPSCLTRAATVDTLRVMFLGTPRGFRSAQTRNERLAMLDVVASVQPLREWAESLAARTPGRVVPSFDPAEAGVVARTLLVLEAPGPMTNALSGNLRVGSGFISVDNDDETAENLWVAREAAGLHDGYIGWNIVPWYLGAASVKPKVAELAEGASALLELIRMLPQLETVVLSGRFAQRGWRVNIEKSPLRPAVDVVETWHPGPQAMIQPGKRAELIDTLRAVAG
jgi:hypothetical protein